MRHTFRLNVYGKGYTLFSGQPSQYKEFPLDIASQGIPRNYMCAQKRIDAMLKTQILRWHFSISNLYNNEFPVIAYGCFLPIPDDRGREGISFVHAIESDEILRMDEIVVCIIQLLSQRSIEEISKLLAGLAQGSCTPERATEFLTNPFKNPYRCSANSSANRNQAIQLIWHDCGGSSAVAWLAMATSHLGNPPPWEIYEEYSGHVGCIATISSRVGASKMYSLSEYLHQLVYKHELLGNLYGPISNSKSHQVVTSTGQEVILYPKALPASSKATKPPSHNENPSNQNRIGQTNGAVENRNASTPPKAQPQPQNNESSLVRSPQSSYPPDGFIVEMNGLRGDALLLQKGKKVYPINGENVLSVTSQPYYYEFIVLRYPLGFFKKRWVLPKSSLTEQQVKDIEAFCELHGFR